MTVLRVLDGKRGRLLTAAVLLLALVLLGYGTWGFWQRYRATHNPHPVIPAETVTHSTSTPDETPPTDACASYRVADTQPRQLQIAGAGISGCIQKVGIDQNHAIAVPTSIYLAGWYTGSALPGQPGVSVIDGHVLGRYNDAIFAKLKTVRINDRMRVQLGDGSWLEFQVVSTNSYPGSTVMDELFKQLPGVDRQLTLITCGGNFDKHTVTYDHRLVVRAKLVSPQGDGSPAPDQPAQV